ncbi:MAG: cation transporter [Treponema sp.]|jgi:copper chaperone CopZ|nr:cation transporter [Treponema sp.]
MKTTLRINGMSCDHCAAHVKEALEAVSGVVRAVVSLKDKSAEVEYDGADTGALKAAVAEAGYEAV